MIFKRKIYNEILKWKHLSSGKSALLIEGARRIGKSTIAEEFAKNEYDDYMLIDFAYEPKEVRNLFENSISNIDNLFRNLFVLKDRGLKGKKCLIIFDEVQFAPKARQAIKFLVRDGRYDYIETGSLISINKNVKDILIPSEEHRIQMFPMDFEEFLWANGDEVTMPAIEEAFKNRQPLGDALHRKIMQRFRTYLAVGGMPQVVSDFVDGKNYEEIDYTKRGILELYYADLEKYDDGNHNNKASAIFKSIPDQLENKNSHFKFSVIDKNARFQNYFEAIDFINKSMIGNTCINVTSPEVSLAATVDRKNFKLYMGDTGLLTTEIMKNGQKTDSNIYKSLIFGKISINEGMIFENMVAQMLKASGHELFFHEFSYKSDDSDNEKNYEIDFLTIRNKKVCPIEVKSSGYMTHKSFDCFIKKYPIKVEDRFVICTKDLRFADGVTYIPIYMTGCI